MAIKASESATLPPATANAWPWILHQIHRHSLTAPLPAGLLLNFSSRKTAAEALSFLKGWNPAGTASPRRRSLSPPIRGFSGRRSPARRTPPPRSPGRMKRRDLPDYASRTLWIGQAGLLAQTLCLLPHLWLLCSVEYTDIIFTPPSDAVPRCKTLK